MNHVTLHRRELLNCCDVDRRHAERFAARYGGRCQVYKDFRELLERKDIDVVTVGTPDHWHTAISIAAMKAGKDVYCEKPLTLTIEEGKLLCKATKATGRVFQIGTQQRSEYGSMFLKAVALARSGRLGKKLTATCSIGGGPSGGPFPTSDPPTHLDWDFWLGQTPLVPYCPQRCHGNFRWWFEYSGGKMTDWGAHHVDIGQWALGYENSGPVEIEGKGTFPQDPILIAQILLGEEPRPEIPNGYNTANSFEINLKFDDDKKMVVRHGPGNGILIEGEKGRIFVNRRKLEGKPIERLSQADKDWLDQEVVKLYKGKKPGSHMGNFFECVKDRSEPVSDVFTHHRVLSSCHLCNIAIVLQRKLRWDPEKEDFIGDDEASQMVGREQCQPYTIEQMTS